MATTVFNGTAWWALPGGRSPEASLQVAYMTLHSCSRTLSFLLLKASAFYLTGL